MDIPHIISILRNGGIGVFQCDTILGLIGPMTPEAAARIRAVKQRAETKPFILLIPSEAHLTQLTSGYPLEFEPLIRRFWPGPLTIVLPKSAAVPDTITGGLSSVGIRLPNFPVLNDVLIELDMPLISTSVNVSGDPEIKTLDAVPTDIKNAVDFCWEPDDPTAIEGVSSTILDGTHSPYRVLREGAIPTDQIEALLRRK